MHTVDEVMLSADAARALSVHPGTLKHWLSTRKLTAYRLSRSVVLVPRAEVEALRATRQNQQERCA